MFSNFTRTKLRIQITLILVLDLIIQSLISPICAINKVQRIFAVMYYRRLIEMMSTDIYSSNFFRDIIYCAMNYRFAFCNKFVFVRPVACNNNVATRRSLTL